MEMQEIDLAIAGAKARFDHADAPYEPDVLALIRAAEAMREELAELHGLFDLQQKRMAEATARWRAEDPIPRAVTLPDLGALLTWLMEDADRARGATVTDFHDAVCTGPGVPSGFTCSHPSHAAS